MTVKQVKNTETRKHLVSGIGLVVLGLLFLAGQLTDWDFFGFLVLPAIALVFIVWGALTRTAGLMIPGGIIGGISFGVGLIELPAMAQVVQTENGEGGLFMLGFAGGWVLITALTALFTDETHWWPLIPAGIMGVIALALLAGGIFFELLTYINYVWPVVLIVVGLLLLFRREKPAV